VFNVPLNKALLKIKILGIKNANLIYVPECNKREELKKNRTDQDDPIRANDANVNSNIIKNTLEIGAELMYIQVL
jgi:hypothetical protein